MSEFNISNEQKNTLAKLAKEILKENIFTDGNDRGYTAASGKMARNNSTEKKWLYPFQWLWDTFFICAWSDNTEQSIFDATKFLNSQLENGYCGHIRYNRDILERKDYFPPPDIYYNNGLPKTGEIISKITQPPNIAFGLLELTKKLIKQKKDLSAIKPLFYKAFKYHEYIYKNRMIENCMVTIHPWESGDDNSPKWDVIYKKLEENIEKTGSFSEIINKWLQGLNIPFDRVDIKIVDPSQRPVDQHYYVYLFLIYLYGQWNWDEQKILSESPFRVLDPMTNAILLKSDLALSELTVLLGINDAQILDNVNNWINISTNGLENLWSTEHNCYFAKDLTDNTFVNIETISCFTTIFSCGISKERAKIIASRIAVMLDKKETNYFIPSTPLNETKYFESDRYWRGPVWIITNELIAQGLSFYEYKDLANKIRENNLSLVLNTLDERGGFYEYYNPITGAGLGSAKQSWTAAAVLSAL